MCWPSHRLKSSLSPGKAGGREFVKSAMRPNFWRPLTDNDVPNGHLDRCGVWRTAADEMKLESFGRQCRPTAQRSWPLSIAYPGST